MIYVIIILHSLEKASAQAQYLFVKLSPCKTSKSPSQPGGSPPSAAGLRWIVKSVHLITLIIILIIIIIISIISLIC